MVVAYIPVYWWRFERAYSAAIGCPKTGDCYVPGSEHLLAIHTGIILTAAILWPLALWKVTSLLWEVIMRIGGGGKNKSGRQGRRSGGYRSPDEFHADFEKRYGKPGRIPEDVVGYRIAKRPGSR
ncbi:MAG: hypothetical protein H6Q41_2999 [Deltaproteobacteria bacterium]|nr:hypothetical protein [Deltaproteobacteria bacterium]